MPGWVPSATVLRQMHLRRLAQHPLRAALAVIGIGAGVALALAVTVSAISVERSLETFGTDLAGPARFRVVGPTDHGGLPEGVLTRIEAVDGVAQAIPLVMGVTEASSGDGSTYRVAFVGGDCRVLTLVEGESCDVVGVPTGDADADPIISSRLGVLLDGGTIHTNLGARSVAAVPQFDLLNAFNEGMVAVYPLPTAQALFSRPGSLDAVYVVPAPGANTGQLRAGLAEAVGPSGVIRDAASTLAPSYITGPFLPFLFLLSLFGLVVGAQLVQNIVAISLAERRRELAVTAAVGGAPAAISFGVLAESAVLGVVGGAVGIGAGVLVAKPFVDNVSAQAELAAGIHLSVHVTPMVVAAGLALGVATSTMAAIRPAWRLRRMDVVSELADRPAAADVVVGVPVIRVVVMAATLVVGLVAGWLSQRDGALETWQPPLAVAALAVAGTAAFRLPLSLAPAVFGVLRRVPAFQRGATRVALSSLTAQPRRVAAATLAVGAAVGLSVGIGNADLAAGSHTLADATADGRVFVSTLRPNNTTRIDAKIPPVLAAELAGFPGVAGIERHYHTTIDHPLLGATSLEGDDGAPSTFDVITGRTFAEAARRGEVMIGPALARDLHLDPGDTFTAPGRDGLVELRVGGIWKSPDNIGRSISAPYPVFRELAGAQPPDSMLLVPAPGLSAAELATRVRAADLDPRLNVFDPDELGERYAEDFGDFVQPFRIIQRGLLGVAFVATASTLLLAALQRRREHGLLMALGMPPSGLGRMVLVEAGLIALAGTAFGWVSGVVGGQLFVFASPVVTGLEVPLTLSVRPVVTAGLLALGFVLAGAGLPAWRTSRLDPMVALRYE